MCAMHILLGKYAIFAGSTWFALEMKEISDDCERFIAFPSGHIYLRKQGGLDSSLIVAVASRYLEEMEGAYQWGSQLHSFCIGLEGSLDLTAAREVDDYLSTRHHELTFTIQTR
ncbi:asparagine synthetase [glutamine-hydrolyzing] 2 isoform X3 [Spinacia oleracea]|uniref:Asparagine synthetase [glutamine-hydrolyzing] 2 isoform X3 n=1 Tax=Spinacia oleracea TaxID=3562 RepID=A0ABM3REP9_SPIOL|nr:asparagine synthetase [glutamine-hydrolyzing] 2-like isoform X3 [Spinacia oleracea]